MTVKARLELCLNWRNGIRSCLDDRGWIIQERILATRTLFYGKIQLSYSCMMDEASELGPLG